MGYDSGDGSEDSRDDDEEEYEEGGSGNRFLGFMFGNVDNSGDLDVDYLDEDAKEHLAALADKLGPSLADIDLSVKSPRTPVDAAEQDYDEKAEDAVDYEDIEEQYEGPEIQAASEEDNLFPEKDYLSAKVPFATLYGRASVYDDENYDEDEENEKEQEVVDEDATQTTLSEVQATSPAVFSEGSISAEHEQCHASPRNESPVASFEEFQEIAEADEEPTEDKASSLLPVLCIENGMVILRFSQIFGKHEFSKKSYRRDHKTTVHKERFKSTDASHAVEEDEEAFLRGLSQGFSSIKLVQEVQDDIVGNTDGDTRYEKYGAGNGEGRFPLRADEDIFLSGGPMKEDLPTDFSTVWQLPQSPNFYPLGQQDWENSILWDSCPLSPDNSAENHDLSRADLGHSVDGVSELQIGSENLKLGHQIAQIEKTDGFGCPATLVSAGSNSTLRCSNLVFSKKEFHPQLLRLESHLEMDKFCLGDGLEDKSTEEQLRHDALTQFSKISLQNKHILDGSWVDEISWEPNVSIAKPKLIFDLQDGRMLFEVLNDKDGNNFWLHAGAMVMTRSPEPISHDSLQLISHGRLSSWEFDIANDIFYSNRKTSQQLNTSSEKRIAYGGEVYHSAPALKLETMKLKLSNKDVAHFHRPKALWYPYDNEVAVKEQGKLSTQGPMKIIVKSLGGKGSKLHVDAEETISSIKTKASKKLDFKLSEPVKIFYRGNELEDHKSLADQNVQPNSLIHIVRTNLHLLPRAQKIPGENKSLRPPGAFKKKSELSVKDGHVFLMEYCEERPLLLSNPGMGARLCTYYQKTAPSDQNGIFLRSENRSLGNVMVLDSTDKSPFLGDIKPGCAQSSLETNMYRAPVFPHKVSSTDYLLIRSAKGKLSVRRIDKINVVGQQEPLMEVMSPGTKDLQSFLMKRVLVYMFRQFRALKKRGVAPYVRTDELSSQFPYLSEAFLRNRLKKHACAELKRGPNGEWIWKMRPNFHIPSEEALRKLVPPDKVCAYESMQAGLYRLKHLGITKLMHPTGIASAMSQLPNEAIALAAASHIERELQITPWNLSSNFVACTNQVRENLERLEISGVGDPSGRGLGFSYVRAAPKAPMSSAMTKKKAAAARGGSTVTGTDADLRRLSMEAAREVLLKFNVPDEIIAKQTRWHRIAMIRELSSEQAASGVKVDPTTISKYARGQRMSFIQLQQQTREKCQEIWDRQLQSLTAIDGDEGASDSESNSDLDSFAGDLENLLDAEEFEGDEAINEHKHDRSDVGKGLKMRRHSSMVEAEEKVQDEAAEALELCKMLMDDDEMELLKKEKIGPVRKEIGPAPVSRPVFVSEKGERVKKPKKVVKQVSSSVAGEGSKQSINGDQEDVETPLAKKNFPTKVKAKKIKILGDGMKIFKEKKSARESFVCGACGQLGHMRTNKNCPRYGEDLDSQTEAIDPDKALGKSSLVDPASLPQQKSMTKKIMPKSATKISLAEATEGQKSGSKTKVHSLKLTCGLVDKPSDDITLGSTQSSDQVAMSIVDAGSKSAVKVNKIVISSKTKPADVQLESHKSSIVIRRPTDADRVHPEAQKTSIVFRPPVDTDKAQIEPHRPSIVIRPPADIEKEQSHKKLIIKRPKEIIDLDQASQEGSTDFEHRKTKKIVELSDFERSRTQENTYFTESSSKKKSREDKRWWEEEEKRRNMERLREERTKRQYMEEIRMLEERERLAEIERYEVSLRREREEEERQKAKKKQKKMKKVETRDEYLEDYRARRNDKRMLERDRTAKRKPLIEPGKLSADYALPTKRRRGGEVGLANILERIVETLRGRQEVSYLFLKPVTKKEAPDYLDIIDKPMDLSTIREKVRRMEYKNREDFRHDVWQITFNAHKYNDGRYPGIPPLADQLLELCDYLLNENDESLTEAEEGIEY
ncbi:transcription initiation factor TFIID subunit 1 isoform X3 [Rhodamnia argentea]|uniref:Transcription initiation factor TFIID subunit 1 n=1 Tax=Rhodamnia argentea TaxID=178133 RepID=A0A8B8PWY2_9MYRT|nr:transcription initiation factor TFIID subunit 1 isoform X3 [Rhodamnia argentea]